MSEQSTDGSHKITISAECFADTIHFTGPTHMLSRMVLLLTMARIPYTYEPYGEWDARIIPHQKTDAFMAIYHLSGHESILPMSQNETCFNELSEKSIHSAIEILQRIAKVEVVIKPKSNDCRFDNL